MLGRILRIGFILFLSVNSFAGKIDKAYEALKIYDYFKAKSLFQELIEDEPVAARFGLCTIYYRNDNPFHNLDTAYAYIQKIEVDFQDLRKKDKQFLLNYSIDTESIQKLKSDIVLSFWNNVKNTKSVKSLNSFINKFPNFKDIEKAKQTRTDLAYTQAVARNTFRSYGSFYSTYPNDPRAEEAKIIYEKKLYKSKTEDGKLQSFIDFIYIYPESPYVEDAEDKIFYLSTKKRTAKSYKWFVDKFPENKNAEEAWRNLFILSFTDFNHIEIRNFNNNNHKFPFPKLFTEAIVNSKIELYQISKNNKWGFINTKGEIVIEPTYEFENDFSNEFALVANEEFVGYINKKGETVIDFIYDDGSNFVEGVASVIKGDSVALINKLGDKVLDFNFSEISVPKNGVILAKKTINNKYVYLDVMGKELFESKEFDYAETFTDSLAIVGIGEEFGIINHNGEILLDLEYKKITRDVDSLFIIQNNESKYGVISLPTKNLVIPFLYDDISKSSEEKYTVFKDEYYGYFDINGNAITKISFKRFKGDLEQTKYKGNFSLTKIRGKYGIIDTLGKKVFPNIFDGIGEIVDYPVPCKKRGKWGYVTKKITLWLPYKYTYAGAFRNGVAIVAKDGKYGVINSKKKVVISFKYSKLSEFKDEYYLAVQKNKYGIIDKVGKIILPFRYDNIKEFKEDIIRLDYKGEVFYYNLTRKMFIYGSLQ